ncbi:hypothetical protein N7454_002112 [Penicillium verhagenii]|nr:hypothetical protein N7454_002112 [Penicillium verhagenii]
MSKINANAREKVPVSASRFSLSTCSRSCRCTVELYGSIEANHIKREEKVSRTTENTPELINRDPRFTAKSAKGATTGPRIDWQT